MSPALGSAFTSRRLELEFASLRRACPKGIYVAPVPDEPLQWAGVLFVRKGQYANAVLRFRMDFPTFYPAQPPVLAFQSDVFHPLVTPLTTYTYSTRSAPADTVSAADEERLPPGGLSLRHGFPEWFTTSREGPIKGDIDSTETAPVSHLHEIPLSDNNGRAALQNSQPPHIVEVLQYLRIIFDTEEVLDAIPLHAAANAGAWHAWTSFRSRTLAAGAQPLTPSAADGNRDRSTERGTSPRPRQQPGGARLPGEWNWRGVWEERVRKSKQASVSEPVLFGRDHNDLIGFVKMDPETIADISPVQGLQAT